MSGQTYSTPRMHDDLEIATRKDMQRRAEHEKPLSLLTFSMGFVVGAIGYFVLIYAISSVFDHRFSGSEIMASFLIIVSVVAVLGVVPLWLLKKLASLSRDVEGDDSRYEMRHFADAQSQPDIISPMEHTTRADVTTTPQDEQEVQRQSVPKKK